MAADLVLFAPDVADRATFDEPSRPPHGISDVWVAGTPLLRNSVSTGARPGRVLARHHDGRT